MKTCAEVLKEAGCEYVRYRYKHSGHLDSLIHNLFHLIKQSGILEDEGIPFPRFSFDAVIFSQSRLWRERQIEVFESAAKTCSAEWDQKAGVWKVERIGIRK